MSQRIREPRAEQGFTLIELLIVIVILGVLAGVVVFAVSGISDRGQASACKAEKQSLATAQEAFYAKATPPAYAGTAAALKAGGLIATLPSWYDTTGGASSYTITRKSDAPTECTNPA
jgi:prepilin-type N-terminal cleavage/methylation domain-containing protein